MIFEAPLWFLLIPILFVLGWWRRGLRLHLPLRVAALLLLILLLVNPKWERNDNSLDLWVLLDRSDSTEDLMDQNYPDWKRILEKAKPSADDEIRVVNFGSEVMVQGSGETSVYTGSRNLTKTALAVQTALAVAREDRPSRVLLFTDGYATESLADLGEKLNRQGVPLDFRLVRDEVLNDYRVSRLQVPTRTMLGEPFVISVTCRGYQDGPLPLTIMRDDRVLLDTTVDLIDGVGEVSFTDRLGQAGAYEYAARISPEEDAHPGNNVIKQWIEISGGPKILLLSTYLNDPLAVSLRRQGFEVELVTDTESLHVGKLTGARACIFNNVPAHQTPREFQKALEFFVRDQGGGLLMIGGEESFGSGEYHESPVDDLLPVSMELKSEHRKISTALAVVMDRSGSMGAQVGNLTKMDLANNGAVNAINLLGNNDYISVTAVDSEPHTFVRMQRLRGNRADTIAKTKSIQAMGGGIYVYNGLEEAYGELKKAPSQTRHVILFSDASDSEQPGNYRELIDDMVDEEMTISVIGLGTDLDVDAPFLADIALRGNGRVFFTEDASEVPVIFSQETVTIARSAFLKDLTGAQATGNWGEVSPKEPNWLASVDGYNLSYARPEATVALVSQDEYVAPLVAYMRVGAGRSMAISFPLGGDYSEKARDWDGYGDFTQTCARWLMGLDMPAGLALRHEMKGNSLTLDLLYDVEDWGDQLMTQAPIVRLTENNEPGFGVMWERIAPGRFRLTHELEEGKVVRGSALVGDYTLPFGPFQVGGDAEWVFEQERIEELRNLAATTGGRELVDIQKAWVKPDQLVTIGIRHWLAFGALMALLLDAFITRVGWPLWGKSEKAAKPKEKVVKHKKVKIPAVKKEEEPSEDVKTPAQTSQSRRARYEKSKRRR